MADEGTPEVGTATRASTATPTDRADRAAAISRATVRVFSDYIGRGPTRARTVIARNVVTVILEDTLTKAEKRLVEEGAVDMVMQIRRRFQGTMRGPLMDAVEEITGQKVVAFLSDHQADPDYASEVFILEALEGGAGESDEHQEGERRPGRE